MRRRSSKSPSSGKRRGVVLLAVLVVTVIMALIAYQFSDRMSSDYQSSINAHRTAQLRHFADSGVHLAAQMLSTPDNIANYLGGNPYDNPERFRNVVVGDFEGTGQAGRFTLIAPIDPDQSSSSDGFRAGVTDETGKININAMIKRDPTGEQLLAMLLLLPNMPADLAACIVDWVDADSDPREGGAEDDHYSGSSPPMRCKNGPLDSLDELLLVKGMTRELLYGPDLNRNGIADADESNFGASSDRGFAAFLTVWSREANRDSSGNPLINVNGDDLQAISDKLSPIIPPDVLNFIILMRQNGPTASTASSVAAAVSGAAGTTSNAAATSNSIAGDLAGYVPDLTKTGSKKLTSLLDLVGAQVSIAGKQGQPATVYNSPFFDPSNLEALATLYQVAMISDDAETPARININTAPREVLMCIDGLTPDNVEQIIAMRPKWGTAETPGPEFQTVGWLVAQGGVSLATLKTLEAVVTARSQVFHVQVVGQFESGMGPTSRVEAIIDTNYGKPRIVFYRDWSELGMTKVPQ